MTLEDDIHHLVLSMEGVATVYSADPVWLAAAKQAASLLGTGGDAAVFVVCREEVPDADGMSDGARPAVSVRLRIGSNGTVPAPALARAVAAGIRTFVSGLRPEVDVKAAVEVSAIGV